MNELTTASIVFVTLFSATLLGMRLRAALPEHHLAPDAKDAVKVGMGSVATMAALVLGLLVASTKSAYDTERNEVIQMAAKIDYLDGVLANYGPEAKACRDMLRGAVERAIIRIWPGQDSQHAQLDPAVSWTDALPNAIYKLAPESDVQRALKSQAVQLINELGQMRWLLYEQEESSISMPLLIVVVSWLAVMFISVGLYAPPNLTVIVALMLAAMSVAGAIFLILELDMPFDGILRISSAPMRNALEHLGQ